MLAESQPSLYELYIAIVYRDCTEKREASILTESLPSLCELYIEAV